jgi:cytochrome c1
MRTPYKYFLAMVITFFVLGAGWFGWSVEETTKQAAAKATGGSPDLGKIAINYHGCGACHTIPGIPGAYGNIGPSLKQIGSRNYIAGVQKNTPQNLMHWIENPQAIDSKTAMPNLHISAADARDITAYLYTLQ